MPCLCHFLVTSAYLRCFVCVCFFSILGCLVLGFFSLIWVMFGLCLGYAVKLSVSWVLMRVGFLSKGLRIGVGWDTGLVLQCEECL